MSEVGQKVIATVRAKAAADPGYVYIPPVLSEGGDIDGNDVRSCVYVSHGYPSCIVGHGLWEAELIDGTFEENIANGYPFVPYNVDDGFGFMRAMNPAEINWLSDVQREQDSRTPWGEAVRMADEIAEDVA